MMNNDVPFFYHEPNFDFLEESCLILQEREIALDGSTLSTQDEYFLFRKMNCLKYLEYLAESPETKQPLHEQYVTVRDLIVQHNIPLVKATVGKWLYRRQLADHDEVRSDCYMWFINLIDHFNYLRHGKFSNYLVESLRTNLSRYYMRRMRKLEQYQNIDSWDTVLDHRRNVNWKDVEEEMNELRGIITNQIADPTLQEILLLRLGLVDNVVWSFDEIAAKMQTTYQNISKRFRVWMVKLFGDSMSTELLTSVLGRVSNKDHAN